VTVVERPTALPLERVVLCIGNFDGVHLGHRRLLQRMRERADQAGLPSVVLTFFPPARVLFGQAQYLTSAAEKLELLSHFGPEAVVLTPFDHAYAQTSSAAFLDGVSALTPDTIIVGENFRFGHGRSGGIADLATATDKLEVFNLQRLDGEVISSSRIRSALAAGDVGEAARLLGAPYAARGSVVEGQRRGRTIGFPTANVDLPPRKALPLGVFAVTVVSHHGEHLGMANVGPRPSFPEEPPALEVHLFDFDGDLYGRDIRVDFRAFVRAQQRFEGIEAVRRQLEIDRQRSLELLEQRSGAAPW
jgi:riboflavin kinase/FMN adenylyltransferase